MSKVRGIQAKYLINLYELKLPNEPVNLNIEGNLYLSNNPKTIEDFFNEEAIPIAGINEVHHTYQSRTYLTDSEKHHESNFDERQNLIVALKKAVLFCQALWLLKDNSIRTELGHLIYTTQDGNILHSNYLSSLFNNALAQSATTEFKIGELEKAVHYYKLLYKISYIELSPITNLRKDTSRITRAYFFLQAARASNDLGTKISQYCTAFECLFSTSNSELKHRLSETVALFLGGNNPLEQYKNMQLAYDLRSSIVHGSHVSTKYSKNNFQLLKETALNCDEYFRQSLKRILDDEAIFELFTNGKSEELNSFFLNLVFEKSI
ncbi:HEPN domain-containing protein [Roseivirga echinicomitans]|uniref:Uncharacterized protein n=1 Tax=Roseivirga echinicomitans TaxID=296218 RepID=A0A150XPV4_9BACT|nr:HEPN domain-containing protein [Roseivirga echinicomitans]KYG80731.1 hypothetical protein AWN68_16620 [Roseivirga echinicomitans]